MSDLTPGAEDHIVAALAASESRVLLTEDKDFGQLAYATGHSTSRPAARPFGLGEPIPSPFTTPTTPGHRVIASVELPAEAGPHLVRVVNEAGASIEGFLDIASDRRSEPPGRMSLGPLPPGAYVVELHGPREHRQERGRIVDRDVYATFR